MTVRLSFLVVFIHAGSFICPSFDMSDSEICLHLNGWYLVMLTAMRKWHLKIPLVTSRNVSQDFTWISAIWLEQIFKKEEKKNLFQRESASNFPDNGQSLCRSQLAPAQTTDDTLRYHIYIWILRKQTATCKTFSLKMKGECNCHNLYQSMSAHFKM